MLDIQPQHRFTLDINWVLHNYAARPVDWGPLGEVTYLRTYSRVKDDGEKEKWWETVQRVVEGCYTIQKWHCLRNHLPWSDSKAERSAREMYSMIFDFKFTPPGRGLWAMGTKMIEEKGGAPLLNCAFISTEHDEDPIYPYTFMMDMSMLGCGVGFDCKGARRYKVVGIAEDPQYPPHKLTVQDSREGWVDALYQCLACWFEGHIQFEFDYSEVREYNTDIKGFGGKASGPEPLRRLLEDDIPKIMKHYVGRELDSEGIVDLMNAIGRCVVAGNVRRTAQIAFSHPKDQNFFRLKDPILNSKRMEMWGWASNNSVMAELGQDYGYVSKMTAQNGEPGYFWMENAQKFGRMGESVKDDAIGANPCSEISLESGEHCNVPETRPARHISLAEYLRTLKMAYLYAKTTTLVPIHDSRSNAIQMRNRRIGLSQTGIIQSINKLGYREHMRWCDEGYNYLRKLDEQYSRWLCIPNSIKITSVKPSGTVSLLDGSTPGIHYPFSEYFIRRIRFDKGSPLVERLSQLGYGVEPDVVDTSAVVVSFPCFTPHYRKGREDVTMWEQLELAAQMQQHWADNQVSVTVTFTEDEAGDIERALEMYESRLKSVAFLPIEDHGYQQAPYQQIDSDDYHDMLHNIKEGNLVMEEDAQAEVGCDGDTCEVRR